MARKLAAKKPHSGAGTGVDEQIERLYDEIIARSRALPAKKRAKPDPAMERAYARLLELQTAAAEDYRKRFEASLGMPLDAGEKLLTRVRTLRDELEDLTSLDSAARLPDKTQAPAKARR